MKKRFLVAVVASAFAVTGATAAPATSHPLAPVAVAKTCSAGYRHAVIGGAEKCLRAGEFCTHRYDRQYRRYGFQCTRFDRRVDRYRLTHA